MYTIYVVTNKVNGKRYVGQTKHTGLERFKSHLNTLHDKCYFHYALRKYGKENFTVTEVAHHEEPWEISFAEKLWIRLLRTWHRDHGYNSTFGGEFGSLPTAETKQKIRAAKLGTTLAESTKQKMSEAHMGEKNHFFGKSHKPETIAAMIEKLKVSHSGEGNYWFGKTLTPEHRANLSASKKGKPKPPFSEETKRKLSELAAARWAERKANPDSSRSIGKPKGPRSKPLVA